MIPSAAQTSDTKFRRAIWLLPAVLGAALYLVNLPGTWIYDDLYFAHEDPRLQDVHRWPEFLTQAYLDGGADKLWRPLVSLSFAVQHWLHPATAWPFHLVNLLLHAGACAMVAKLGTRLTGRGKVGLVAGLLFAAHPVHVEAVSGIVGRAEECCALGVLGALLLSVGRTMTPRRAVAVTGCFCLAALSKEQGILLPFILLWAWWLFRPEPTLRRRDHNGRLCLIALLTCTMAIYISCRNQVAPWYWDKSFLDWPLNPIVRSAGADRWLIPVAVFGRYVSLLVAPWRLAPDYSAMVFTPVQSWSDPHLWIGSIALLIVLAAVVVTWQGQKKVLLFCIGCFAITYFLVSNVIVIGTIFGERLMYLPSAFFCIVAGMGLARLSTRGTVLVGLIIVAFCIRTDAYARHWNDRLGFYRYAVGVQPRSAQLYLLLGDELEKRHADLEGAEKAYAQGRAICPDYSRMLYGSAHVAMLRGRYDEAEAWARRSMKVRPAMSTSELLTEIEARRAKDE